MSRDDSVTKGQGWVVYLDVYGFTTMVDTDANAEAVARNLLTCHKRSIEFLGSSELVPEIYMFSDSVYLFYPVLERRHKYNPVLETCFLQIRTVLDIFTDGHLPLRGGIAYGNVWRSESVLIGPPITRAHSNEARIRAPVVWLPGDECLPHPSSSEPEADAAFLEMVELKGENVKVPGRVITPGITGFTDLVEDIYRKCVLHRMPSNVVAAWESAKNWIEHYVQKGRNHGYDRY